MALTLDATVKGVSANSYITQADADSYFDGRMSADEWTGASSSDKDQALVMATSRLEQERFRGKQTTTTQRLKWPRIWVQDDDGRYFDQDTIPRVVEEATCEMALVFLRDGVPGSGSGLEEFEEVKLGPISVKPSSAGKSSNDLPDVVRRLLRRVLVSSLGTVRLNRTY